jgi:hypothetical protein
MIARRLVLSLIALSIADAAHALSVDPPAMPVSLVVAGHWGRVDMVGSPPCPQDMSDCLSFNVIADVRLGDARTLAGPRVPALLTARFEFHAPPARDYEQILLVRRPAAARGPFEAISLGRARRGRRVCVDRQALAGNHVPIPRHTRSDGDEICFPPPSGRPTED